MVAVSLVGLEVADEMEVAAAVVECCCEVYCRVAKVDRFVFDVTSDAHAYASDLVAELQNLQANVSILDV